MNRSLPIAAIFPFLCLAACCQHATKPIGELPAPITKSQQIADLNARAKQVQTLKARGSIAVAWTDDSGNHSVSADAVVLVKQRTPEHAFDPGASVLLIGKVAGGEVFEMGVNAKDHWTAQKVDPKIVYIGPMNVPPSEGPANVATLRADRVLSILALAQIGESESVHLAMTANGEAGGPHVNELHALRFMPPFGVYIERTYVIDRHTGNISEIRSYFPDGRIESVATLSDYKTGKNMDGSTTQIQFPGKLVIEDPSDKFHIELTMDSYDVNPTLPPRAFDTPDFAHQGLKVVPVN